jgi:hypothetical protein
MLCVSCGVEVVLLCGFRVEVNPLATFLMLQSLLSAGCSFLQFGQLSCGHVEWVSAHVVTH